MFNKMCVCLILYKTNNIIMVFCGSTTTISETVILCSSTEFKLSSHAVHMLVDYLLSS